MFRDEGATSPVKPLSGSSLRDQHFRSLVSGEKTGLGPASLRFLLSGLSGLYGGTVCLRNALYDRGVFRSHRASVPVISVGNLTTGGTGKTPFVVWLAQRLQERGLRPGVLTRGYNPGGGGIGDEDHHESDEVTLLRHHLKGVPVCVGPDRVKNGKEAVSQGANALLLDDGFQHRRLERDVDIVLVDALCPFGFERMLPRGFLREPFASLQRATGFVLTRVDQAGAQRASEVRRRLEELAPGKPIAEACHQPAEICSVSGGECQPPSSLAGRSVVLVAGVGNPESFLATVGSLKANVLGSLFFSDHHIFTAADASVIRYHVVDTGADLVLTTEKDVRRGEELVWAGVETAYLRVEMKITRGEEELLSMVEDGLSRHLDRSTETQS